MRKKYGQHFLNDEQVAEKIVSFADIKEDDAVLEIGPGRGILTYILLKHAQNVVAVEIDERLVSHLKRRFSESQNFTLVHEDFLKYDLPVFPEKIKIIGNLPYNAGTRIIMRLMDYRERYSEMIFMLQKEVVERLVASPGTKAYGSLSVFIQLYFDVQNLMSVSPESFSPPPKVFSALIKMKPKKQLIEQLDNPELFHKIVKLAFSHRRKTLRNNFKVLPLGNNDMKEIGLETGIDLGLRGEMLSIKDYFGLTRSINKFI